MMLEGRYSLTTLQVDLAVECLVLQTNATHVSSSSFRKRSKKFLVRRARVRDDSASAELPRKVMFDERSARMKST